MSAAEAPSPPSPGLLPEALAIGLGGAIGTSLRAAVQAFWPAAATAAAPAYPFLEPILVANVVGAAVLGFVLGRITGSSPHPLLRPFLCVGVLGSFTTWSSLIAETTALAGLESESAALLKLGGSLVLGLVAFALGERAGRPTEGTRP